MNHVPLCCDRDLRIVPTDGHYKNANNSDFMKIEGVVMAIISEYPFKKQGRGTNVTKYFAF